MSEFHLQKRMKATGSRGMNLRHLCFATLVLAAGGCEKPKEDAALRDHELHIQRCRVELAQSPLVPIVGGGHLDTKYFAFNVPTVRYEEGKCGTDGFESDFYWTGKEILPAAQKFTGFSPSQIPKEWRLYQVGAVLGNLSKANACKADPTLPQCRDVEKPGYPATWTKELIVKPTHFPGLEVWLDTKPVPKGVTSIHFVLTDWRRADGRPRTANCGVGRDVALMTQAELLELDFGTRTFSCQMEYWDFPFKGGAARVRFRTDALNDVSDALQALNHYISNAVVQEPAK